MVSARVQRSGKSLRQVILTCLAHTASSFGGASGQSFTIVKHSYRSRSRAGTSNDNLPLVEGEGSKVEGTMKTRDELLKNLVEKEIHKFYVVHSQAHFCLECGRETWRPKICRSCLERKTRADLQRRTAIVTE